MVLIPRVAPPIHPGPIPVQQPFLRSFPLALALTLAVAGRPPAQEAPPAAEQAEQAEQDADEAKPKKDRPGIPVDDPVVHTHCVRCHALDDRGHMTRISYLRKSPEGWAETLKRMIRLYDMQVDPDEAKEVVRSLSNSHGLARSEAERGLYESERRVHWSEEQHDQDFKRACAQCHPLGRVLLQQRDAEEWQLLRATHVAMFPLSRGQMGGGPPREQSGRFGGGPPPGVVPTTSNTGRGGGSQSGQRGGSSQSGQRGGGQRGGSRESVGDRVLAKLAKDQPLFTDAWRKWTKNRRSVPLQGTWTVTGHEVGRGDLVGRAVITRTGDDEYDVRWELQATDGSTIDRTGKGLLYAGYSWRGRSSDGGEGAAQWREVLLLDDHWNTLKGRTFTGTHDEIGADLTLHRQLGRPRVLAAVGGALAVPSTGNLVDVYGESFPEQLAAESFFVGEGLEITAVERVSAMHARLTIDVAAGTELGPRTIAYGTEPGGTELQLYDTVDYIRITPLQGLARVGGARHPAQIERFEAIARHRGADKKPFTDDDVDLFQVRPRWGLEEFMVREDDDDLQYVGAIDPNTGVFTPAIDGPNPQRKWQANNIGDVFVTAEIELEVPVRPPEKKPDEDEEQKSDDKPGEGSGRTGGQDPVAQDPVAEAAPKRETKTFRARSHLIVTVPLYVKWAALDWEDR